MGWYSTKVFDIFVVFTCTVSSPPCAHLIGRNCGYAKYNSAHAAAAAVAALNMMEISEGVVAKVCIANPQVEGVTAPASKRS